MVGKVSVELKEQGRHLERQILLNQWEELARQIAFEMEKAVELSIPLEVDLKMGKNWADMEPFKLKHPAPAKMRP